MSAADVVVVGAGVAGLVAAHEVAAAGGSVVVCEATEHLGGLVRRGALAGIDVDLGAESFATRTDAVTSLIADAGLPLEVTAPRPGGASLAVAGPDGIRVAALPARTILGIPADPTAPDVVALIGQDAAERAARERGMPLADGAEPSLFDLVAERCGTVVAERLVDTLARSVYSRPAAQLRLSQLHPAMWEAFRAHGSLTAAAAEIATGARAGAAVGGIVGGMWRLPASLARSARAHGADIRTETAVHRVDGDARTGFVVRMSGGDVEARHVVLATGPAAVDAVLGVDASGDPRPERVRVVAAAIDHLGLDAFPVGSGVIVDPALPTAAKALTHVTAKWEWPGRDLPRGRHIVRLSARDADAPGLATPADIAREVSALTGLAIRTGDVVDVVVQDWTDAVASTSPARTARLADAAARGIHVTGAVVAGTGLAAVIPHARALAATLRGRVAGGEGPTDAPDLSAPPSSHLSRSTA